MAERYLPLRNDPLQFPAGNIRNQQARFRQLGTSEIQGQNLIPLAMIIRHRR